MFQSAFYRFKAKKYVNKFLMQIPIRQVALTTSVLSISVFSLMHLAVCLDRQITCCVSITMHRCLYTLGVFISLPYHHHPALLHHHALILNRLLTFLTAFSTPVLKSSFSQSLSIHNHVSFSSTLTTQCSAVTGGSIVLVSGGLGQLGWLLGALNYFAVMLTYSASSLSITLHLKPAKN